MPSASVPVTVAPRIAALVRMLASPADGEALNAARALGRTLSSAGLDFHPLASLVEHPIVSPPTPPYQSARRWSSAWLTSASHFGRSSSSPM